MKDNNKALIDCECVRWRHGSRIYICFKYLPH